MLCTADICFLRKIRVDKIPSFAGAYFPEFSMAKLRTIPSSEVCVQTGSTARKMIIFVRCICGRKEGETKKEPRPAGFAKIHWSGFLDYFSSSLYSPLGVYVVWSSSWDLCPQGSPR